MYVSSATQPPARMKVNTKPRGQVLLLWFHTPSFSCPHTSPRAPPQTGCCSVYLWFPLFLLISIPGLHSPSHSCPRAPRGPTLCGLPWLLSHLRPLLWISTALLSVSLTSHYWTLFSFLYVLNLVTLKIPEWRTVWTVFHPLYYLEWRPDAMRNTYWATL